MSVKKSKPQVSYHYKPEEMSLQEWQIALRKQAAMKEFFAISSVNEKQNPGEYKVINPISRSEYKVVFRGEESEWNYCSCMDFRTSRLGTCKHIESVALWIEKFHKRVHYLAPPYTSVYLSYRGPREVRIRIGTDNEAGFRALAAPYFDEVGRMRADAAQHIPRFIREAHELSDTFRWYSDVLDFVVNERDIAYRKDILTQKYSDTALDHLLKTTLYTYQKQGIRFAFQAGKSIIADEMGLGKTIQAIGTAELLKKEGLINSVLILCPTSLKYQWKKELERFTNSSVLVVEGNHLVRTKLYKGDEFYKIVSYNSISNDLKVLGSLHTDLVIMDEVQRLKNWKTQISKNARRIESDYSVILSGTPLENKLEELYSIVQFVDQYCLGPYYEFMNNTVMTTENGQVIGYKNLHEAADLLKNVLIRRRKRDVSLQLPSRMDKILFVPMTEQQMAVHEESKSVVAQLTMKWKRQRFLSEKDRNRLLLSMSQMRMVSDSTYILDQKSRHDTKVTEVMQILQDLFDSGDEKVVIFSQWERMTRLITFELDQLGVQYEYLHGGIPSIKRKDLVDNFTSNPDSRVFISTDAGSTGLNLQAASMIINLDLPWNPAVLEQRIARIYRIGQQRNIQVINLVSSGTIEERMLSTLNFKSALFEGILDGGGDTVLLEENKFNKMMESFTEILLSEEELPTDTSHPVVDGDMEEVESSPVETETWINDAEPQEVPITPQTTQPDSPEALLQQGFSFFSGLARTLSSPEATEQFVSSIVEENKETGEVSLRIPVASKKAVSDMLTLFGKLLQK